MDPPSAGSLQAPDGIGKHVMLLPELISHNGHWRARHPAIVSAEGTLTWEDFAARVERIATGLSAAGLAGERIGIVMDNEPAAIEIICGAMRAGTVAVPLNISVADPTIDTLLMDADIRGLFVSPAHRARIGERARALAILLVSTGEPSAGWQPFTDWRDSQPTGLDLPFPAGETLCNIIYSSGTTGAPKGIVHSHAARANWVHDLAHALRYHSGARTLLTTGLYSNITWVSMLPTLMLGGTLVLHAGFDAAAVLETFQRERISHVSMVPIQLQRLFAEPDFSAAALSSLQSVMCCGSPLAADLKADLLYLLPSSFFELYGSTEGIITTLAPEEAPAHMASVGRPLPGEGLAIIDGDDQLLPTGEPGEVVALSRFAMEGYWRRPDATADMIWTDGIGRHWLRSGDIGRIDPDGYLTITDRKKDMIISGGQNIYPADIEAVILAHPAVSDCAVIGVPSEKWGETPLAIVVARGGMALDDATLLAWTNERLGRQQKASAVELRSEIPRNPNGKVLKRELRAAYWPGRET